MYAGHVGAIIWMWICGLGHCVKKYGTVIQTPDQCIMTIAMDMASIIIN